MLCGIIVIILQINIARSAIGKAYCISTPLTGTGDFIMEFQLDTEGDPVTSVSFYNATEDPDFSTKFESSPCVGTASPTGTIYNVRLPVDTSSLPCGAQDLDGNEHKFAVLADGINKVFTFSCDTDDLAFPSSVSESFSTPVLENTLHIRNNPRGVKFQVIDTDYRMPTSSVKLGRKVILVSLANFNPAGSAAFMTSPIVVA